jgi:hypothetical protein
VTISTGCNFLTSTGNYTQTGGTTSVNGTLDPAGIVDIQAGILNGGGTVNSNVTNAGQVNPGTSPDILSIVGDYTQTATGALNIEIGGTSAGSQHDRLAVSGTATLAGTANISLINGFLPGAPDAFTILTFASRTGDFATYTGLTFPGGLLEPVFNPGDLTLLANLAPLAVNDSDATLEDNAKSINVVANDSDPDLDPFSVVAVTQPANGSVVNNGDGTVTYTPNLHFNGMDSFTYTIRDRVGLEAMAMVTLTVTPVNDAPAFDAIPNQTVDEDSGSHNVSITGIGPGGGPDETTQTVTMTAVSSDPSIVPHPSISGAGATRTLTFTPAMNANGMVTITVTAVDDGGTANGGVDTFSRVFTILVNPVNDAPVVANPIADLAVDEDAAPVLNHADLNQVFDDVDDPDSAQTYTITATTPAGIVTAVLEADDTLDLSFLANQNGVVDITVRATDPGGLFVEDTFRVTVNAVNDAPVVANPIADMVVNEDAAPVLNHADVNHVFADVDNADSVLTYTITGNTPAGIVTAVLEADDTLDLSFLANQNGVVDITVRATDPGGLFAEDTFQVTVTAVNDPPVFDTIANQSVSVNSGPHNISITGIGPGGGADEAGQTVTLIAVSGPHPQPDHQRDRGDPDADLHADHEPDRHGDHHRDRRRRPGPEQPVQPDVHHHRIRHREPTAHGRQPDRRPRGERGRGAGTQPCRPQPGLRRPERSGQRPDLCDHRPDAGRRRQRRPGGRRYARSELRGGCERCCGYHRAGDRSRRPVRRGHVPRDGDRRQRRAGEHGARAADDEP